MGKCFERFVFSAIVAALGCYVSMAQAQINPPPPLQLNQMRFTVAAQASPDECVSESGDSIPYENPCPEATPLPKTNQAYVWGHTRAQGREWFGTIANTLCIVEAQLAPGAGVVNDGTVICGNSIYSDFRPPRIYSYNPTEGLVDRTGSVDADSVAQPLRQATSGLRAAFNNGGVVFVAGPAVITATGSINVFAFNASTGAFIQAAQLPYGDVRFAKTVNGVLYVGVGPSPGSQDGYVLRWYGNSSHPFSATGAAKAVDPINFGFRKVGVIPNGSAAYIDVFENHLVVNSWSSNFSSASGLYMSPRIPTNGLQPITDTTPPWTSIFNYAQYEPDPAVRLATLGGAIGAFNGWLYFATMSVPGMAAAVAQQLYGVSDTTTFLATLRGTSVFRVKDLDGARTVQLLYGENRLPKFNPGSGQWVMTPNASNLVPKYGPSGFGNIFNTYSWTAENIGGYLFYGTFDWNFVTDAAPQGIFWQFVRDAYDVLNLNLQTAATMPDIQSLMEDIEGDDTAGFLAGLRTNFPALYDNTGKEGEVVTTSNPLIMFSPMSIALTLLNSPGGDLWVFPSSTSPAYPENVAGAGNILNYGIRNITGTADGSIYIGTANPYNLAPTQKVPYHGGWELIRGAWRQNQQGQNQQGQNQP